MGVVNTSYTFTATDTITSAKMNNIIDDTIMTSTAVSGSTLQVTPSGQLAVNSQGITSNELASAAATQSKIGANVATTGPAFFAYLSANQSLPNTLTSTTVRLDTKIYDTASCFNTSTYRFTPNVAGYYQINASIQIDRGGVDTLGTTYMSIRKNGVTGSYYDIAIRAGLTSYHSDVSSGSALIYMNGSTDYIELAAAMAGGSSSALIFSGNPAVFRTYVSGFLARTA